VILYYAAGGGLGHLTRARTVLDALEPARPAALLTPSPFAADPRVTAGRPVVRIPSELDQDPAGYRDWLSALIGAGDHEALYVDSFPGGVLGELCGLEALAGIEVRHVARRLRWAAYEPRLRGPLPRFDRTWVLEELEDSHASAVAGCSERVDHLDLAPTPADAVPAPDLGGRPLWVVVHSGPEDEVADLIAYADEQRIQEGSPAHLRVVSPAAPRELPPGADAVDLYPAASLYPHAERIFTASGFNAMRETEPFRDRHRFVPYPRALDDQHARAAAARA
jgi:hypothetical protein